mgnify:CR=1 FL=1
MVTRRKSSVTKQFADVTLKCLGKLTGWQPVGDYEYTRVKLVTGNFQNVENCSNGQQEMSSTAPFGVTVWGWGSPEASPSTIHSFYAYPAGASGSRLRRVSLAHGSGGIRMILTAACHREPDWGTL